MYSNSLTISEERNLNFKFLNSIKESNKLRVYIKNDYN